MPISAARFDFWQSFDEEMLSIVGPHGGYTHVSLSGEAIEQRRLFAAAPDLLAALEHAANLIADCQQHGCPAGPVAIPSGINAAIAKAKGDASW